MQIDIKFEAAFRRLTHADFAAGLAAGQRQFLQPSQMLEGIVETRGVAKRKELLRHQRFFEGLRTLMQKENIA